MKARAVWARIFGYRKGQRIIFTMNADLFDRISNYNSKDNRLGEIFKGDKGIIEDKTEERETWYWIRLTHCKQRNLKGKIIKANEQGFVLDVANNKWNFLRRRKDERL